MVTKYIFYSDIFPKRPTQNETERYICQTIKRDFWTEASLIA